MSVTVMASFRSGAVSTVRISTVAWTCSHHSRILSVDGLVFRPNEAWRIDRHLYQWLADCCVHPPILAFVRARRTHV